MNGKSEIIIRETQRTGYNQEERIHQFFQGHRGELFTPDEVHELVFEGKCPLTSVRRAMTNLTTAGHLEKLLIRRLGPYDKKVHTWRLNERR